MVEWRGFPGFREAFDTGEVAWDIDPAPVRRRAVEIYEGVCESANRKIRGTGVVHSATSGREGCPCTRRVLSSSGPGAHLGSPSCRHKGYHPERVKPCRIHPLKIRYQFHGPSRVQISRRHHDIDRPTGHGAGGRNEYCEAKPARDGASDEGDASDKDSILD